MALLPWVWYGGSLARIDLSYVEEDDSGVAKILVSGDAGVETALEIAVPTTNVAVAYGFGYLSSPSSWVAGAVTLVPPELLRFRQKGEDVVEPALAINDVSGFMLFAAGIYCTRTDGGVARLYYRDGTQFSQSGAGSQYLIFPGRLAPFGAYRFAPDLTHCLRRTAVATIEYRDNAGAVRNLTVSGATLPQFRLDTNRYTYVPPYLYAIEGVNFFNPSVQTVTVHRNLVDLTANTVTLDGELQAQCQGINFEAYPNTTSLTAVFYPP